MTALARDRLIKERHSHLAEFPLKAGAVVYRGGLVAITAAAEALRPGDAGATKIVGVAEVSSAEFLPQAGLNAGALPTGIVSAGPSPTIRVRRNRQFAFFNSSGGDLVTTADWGAPVYAVDDQTVAKTDGGGARLLVGVCRGVDADGVWVQVS